MNITFTEKVAYFCECLLSPQIEIFFPCPVLGTKEFPEVFINIFALKLNERTI